MRQVFPPVRTLGLLSLCLWLSAAGINQACAGGEPILIERHIIIAHDISGSVTKKGELLNRINQYLPALLCQGLSQDVIDSRDHLDGDLSEPLWRPGDGLTYLTFGMEENALSPLRQSSRDLWLQEFNRALISRDSFLIAHDPGEVKRSALLYLSRSRLNRAQYTLSRYLFPFLLASLPEDVFPRETWLIVVSDFRYGESQDNIGDREVVRAKAGREFLKVLEEKQMALDSHFSLSRPRGDLNVGGVNGIFLRCMKVRLESPPEGSFLQAAESLTLTRDTGEKAYPFPRFIFRSNGVSPWMNLNLMGLRLWGKDSKSPVFLAEPPSVTGNDVWVDLPHLTPAPLAGEKLPEKGCFFLAGHYRLEHWQLGFLLESRPFPLAYANRKVPQQYRAVQWGALIIMPLALLLLLFGRTQKVAAAFAAGDETRLYKEVECRLFEYTPGGEGELCRIPVELSRKKSWCNLRSKAKTHLTIKVDPGSFPITTAWFEDNRERDLAIGQLGKRSRIIYIIVPLANLLREDLWNHDLDSPKGPFVLRLIVRNGSQEEIETLHGLLVERPSTFWLGLDPGTSGSCVFGGNQPDEIRPVPLTDEGQTIMPSIITFREAYHGPQNPPYNESTMVCGNPYVVDKLKSFSSVKRLIGYENELELSPTKTISGEYVQSILIDYLVMKAAEVFKDNQEKPAQAVVAVPNSFTPAKIKLMKDCCRQARNLQRVEHIYEIEAILLYYFKKLSATTIEFLPVKALVIDFGGSTLNVAVATLREDTQTKKIILDMHSRLGFNIGGDTLTAIIAKSIWELHRDHFLKDFGSTNPEWKKKDFPHPIQSAKDIPIKKKASWEDLCDKLWERAESVKKNLPNEHYPGIEESEALIDLLKEIKAAIQEVVAIFKPSPNNIINKIIISGRSSLFPPFKEQVKEIMGELEATSGLKPDMVSLSENDDEELKYCVAEGAAFYGIQKRNIELTRDKTFAHFGLEEWVSTSVNHFINMIPMNTFFDNGAVRADLRDLNLQCFPLQLSFYQIMAANPEEAFNQKHRRLLIQRFPLDGQEMKLETAKMELDTNDRCEILAKTSKKIYCSTMSFKIEDIRTEMDEYTTWRLA